MDFKRIIDYADKLLMNILGKIFILFFLITQNALAVNICENYYLGYVDLISKSQFNRAQRMVNLKKITQFFRKRKSNPKIVEVDRAINQNLTTYESQLMNGNTYIFKEDFSGFIFDYQTKFIKYEKYLDFYKFAKSSVDTRPEMVIQKLLNQFKNSPIEIEVLKLLESKQFNTVEGLVKFLEKEIKSNAKYIGKNFQRYKLTFDYLDELLNSKSCTEICLEKLTSLKKQLGIESSDSQQRFSMYEGRSAPTIEYIGHQINLNPHAYEAIIIKKTMGELKAFFRDIISVPNSRRAFAKLIYDRLQLPLNSKFVKRFSPKLSKLVVKTIDNVLTDVDSVNNHFPIIKQILKLNYDVDAQFNRLINDNVIYPDDALLVTFSRRKDKRARDSWKDLSIFAKENDPTFYKRIVAANRKASIKGDLSSDFQRSPFRTLMYIVGTLGTGSGVAYLGFGGADKTEVSEEIGELEVGQEELDVSNLSDEEMNILSEGIEFLGNVAKEYKTKN